MHANRDILQTALFFNVNSRTFIHYIFSFYTVTTNPTKISHTHDITNNMDMKNLKV